MKDIITNYSTDLKKNTAAKSTLLIGIILLIKSNNQPLHNLARLVVAVVFLRRQPPQ